MTSKNTKPVRVDIDFEKDMRGALKIRLVKGLATMNELGMAEMTRLLRRTTGYQLSLEELKTKPKRR